MLHIGLHFIVPLAIALICYRSQWRQAALILVATILVDADHLLADPVYDPQRCSIGFHPLHTAPAIGLYALMFTALLIAARGWHAGKFSGTLRVIHLMGLGLLIHMGLDWLDCHV